MKKSSIVFKKLVAVVTMAAALACGIKGAHVVSGDAGVVAEAAGRPVSITSCVIQGGNVVVNVSCSNVPSSDDGKFYLYSDEVYQDGTTGKIVATTDRGNNASFAFPLGYNSAESNLSKKFLVAVKSGGSMVQVSDEHYITNPEGNAYKTVARNDRGIKGILPNSADAATFNDLGVTQMVYNLYMGDIVASATDPGAILFNYNGVDYYFNAAALGQYDAFVQWCASNKYQLTLTILNNKTAAGADLIHPLSRDAHVCPGYAMNTKEDGGTKHLKAIAAFLAMRYSGGAYGTVDNWVIGNEVNARTEWYYMSSTNLELNVSEYVKAFRIFYNEIKAVNANARIYNSIDQEWQRKSNPGCSLSKDFLDRFNYYMVREGNVDWSISIHPYNAPLFDPYAWKQQSQYVSNNVSTKYITMENIYVFTDYMCQPAFLNPAGQVRNIALTEIGYTSEFGEDAQAASIVYAYTMAANNPYIKSFILFRETDNAHEMESHIAQGLKNLDGTPKMAYNYYKAMGTAQQETYKAQASAIIGADINSMVANRTFLTRNGWFLND